MKNKLRDRMLATLLVVSLGVLAAPSVAIKKCGRIAERVNEKSSKRFIAKPNLIANGPTVTSSEKQMGGYSISASPSILPACSVEPVTFHCVTPYISTGFWTFKWTVGSGWSNPGIFTTTSNNIMLLPASATGTPSAVSVTAIYTNNNGNSSWYNVGACPVFRSTVYKSDALITGSASCSGSNVFNISGLKTGETVAWSVSDTAVATLSNSTNTQTTITLTGSGSCNLIATITNSCGQSTQKTYMLYAGAPVFKNFTCSSYEGNDFCSGSVGVPYTYLPSLSSSDKITAEFAGLSSSESANSANWEWELVNTNITIFPTRNMTRIGMTSFGQTGVRVRAKNACGWSDWQELDFEIIEIPDPSLAGKNNMMFSVYPVPASETLTIEKGNVSASEKAMAVKTVAELYNMRGIQKGRTEIVNNKAAIDVSKLESGVYILKIHLDGKIESHQVLIK